MAEKYINLETESYGLPQNPKPCGAQSGAQGRRLSCPIGEPHGKANWTSRGILGFIGVAELILLQTRKPSSSIPDDSSTLAATSFLR